MKKNRKCLSIVLVAITLAASTLIACGAKGTDLEASAANTVISEAVVEGTTDNGEAIPEASHLVTANKTQAQVQAEINAANPGIVCWGDSITAGMCGEGVSYPGTLHDLIDKRLIDPIRKKTGYTGLTAPEVVNMGVSGESSTEIGGRQGGLAFVITEEMTIPAGTEEVNCRFASPYILNYTEILRNDGYDIGVNPVSIGGIQGTLTTYWEMPEDRIAYRFHRTTPGTAKTISVGTQIWTTGSQAYRKYIPIIAMGSNGEWDVIEELITQYQAMIDYSQGPKDKYLVLGMMKNFDKDITKIKGEEAAMQQFYGAHYMSIRKELNERGLQIAGIKPTAEDKTRIKQGWIPASLLNKEDMLHNTPKGYAALGEIVYQKMDSLGYFDELKTLSK